MNTLLVTSPHFIEADRVLLERIGATAQVVTSAEEGIKLVCSGTVDRVLICGPLTDSGIEAMLQLCSKLAPAVPVVVRNRDGTISEAIRCIKAGAASYYGPDSIGLDGEVQELGKVLTELRRRDVDRFFKLPWQRVITGDCPASENVVEIVRLVSTRRSNVLVFGKPGTGRHACARAIHESSGRAARAMIVYDCVAQGSDLLERRLFEQCNRATLLLKDVTALTASGQLRLLDRLHEREEEKDLPVGTPRRLDCRIIATCDDGIKEKLALKEFREDLYYRLSTVCIQMPLVHEIEGSPL